MKKIIDKISVWSLYYRREIVRFIIGLVILLSIFILMTGCSVALLGETI